MTDTSKNDFNASIGNTVLCDGFLIPMTDFVNNVGNMENYPSHENALSWIYNYTTFLKQPLKLEMFVPCDDEGNILEEPEDYEQRLPNMMTEYNDEIYRYEQAKEKVLFENLSYKFGFVGLTDSKGNFSSLFDLDFKPNGIIEDLLKEKYKFSFTAFALERIFGKTGA